MAQGAEAEDVPEHKEEAQQYRQCCRPPKHGERLQPPLAGDDERSKPEGVPESRQHSASGGARAVRGCTRTGNSLDVGTSRRGVLLLLGRGHDLGLDRCGCRCLDHVG